MSKFDYMVFTGGKSDEFVVHAKKYTKEQAIELMLNEMDYLSMSNEETSDYRLPTVTDVDKRYVRYYVRVPDWCGYDGEGGCYTYCNQNDKGCFPVWVIQIEDLIR